MSKTILLTGISGFIAKRIALDLLEAGYIVRGSLRSMARVDEVRAALSHALSNPASLERLDFVTLDLTQEEGWAEAMADVDAVVHTASPFPMTMPKDEQALIGPAVDGTLRALKAAQAAGVTRVVLTSSVVAIEANDKTDVLTNADWSDPDHPRSTAYYKSKTLAERAAWDFCAAHPEMALTTINPGLVLGAPLDKNYGTSLDLVERLLSGKDPMLPNIGFGVVDVADVSAMHVAALSNEASVGQRFIATAGSLTFPEMAQHLAATHPGRKIATRIAPKFILQILSLFDASIKTVLPGLGSLPKFDSRPATDVLGVRFTSPKEAIDKAAKAVLAA